MANWYAVRCNIKCEDKAERNLRDAGFRTYAPWQHFERFSKRKTVWIQHRTRIVPRYIFVETPEGFAAFNHIRKCEGVEHILGPVEHRQPGDRYARLAHRPRPLSAEETRQLLAVMAAEDNFEFDETRAGKLHRREIGKTKRETTRMKYPAGTRVRINDGPFATFKGEVTNVNGRGHIEVLVNLFGRLSPVELETEQVEAA
jgi:transcription antitermination factor NusG